MSTANTAHRITIGPAPGVVRVICNGATIIETSEALILREGSLPPVIYVPRASVDAAVLVRSDHRTHCPFKGDASYFTLEVDGRCAENAAWSYEQPLPAVAAIKDCLAFYRSKVDAIEVEGEVEER